MNVSRKQFLRIAGAGATVSLAALQGYAAVLPAQKSAAPKAMALGLASYTLRKLDLDGVIDTCKRLGLENLALKSMHMPLDASTEDIQAMAARVRNAGLRLYGAGVIYMKTKEEVDNAFRYARAAGLEMIIGVPNHELLPQVNTLVRESDIKVAIHNHGPGDDLYASPHDVWAKIKGLDKRIGFCIDIGHVVRIGQDPVPMLEQYKARLYDMHMKDVSKAVPEGESIEIGRGVIDIPAVVRMLRKINYKGYVGFEYEKDGDAPVPGLAESVGFVRGVTAVV